MTSVKPRREFTCSVCSKTYTRSPALSNHLRNHSGERPYSCTECDRAFMSRDSLRSHQAVHLPVNAKLSCVYCDQKFSRMSCLKRHEKKSCSGAIASASLASQGDASLDSTEEVEGDIQHDPLLGSLDSHCLSHPDILSDALASRAENTLPMSFTDIQNISDSEIERMMKTYEWSAIFRSGLSARLHYKMWWAAAKIGHAPALKDLCKKAGIDVNLLRVCQYPLCETALSICSGNGNSNATAALLDMDAMVDMSDVMCPNPLLLAVKSGDLSTVKVLLSHKSFISLPDTHTMEAVHAAAKYSSSQLFQFVFTQVKIDLDLEGAKLLRSVTQSDTQTSEKLALILEQLVETKSIDSSGHTALHVAATEANVPLMQKVLELSQDPAFVNAKTGSGDTALHLLLRQQFFEWGRTLHSHLELVEPCLKLLLANGADVNIVSNFGLTPVAIFEQGLERNLTGSVMTRCKLDEIKWMLVQSASGNALRWTGKWSGTPWLSS